MNTILILILIFVIFLVAEQWFMYEYFGGDAEYGPYNRLPLPFAPGYPYLFNPYYNYTNFPFWNMPLGTTRNMSYDLRGDPIVIPRTDFVWNNSSIFPIYNNLSNNSMDLPSAFLQSLFFGYGSDLYSAHCITQTL